MSIEEGQDFDDQTSLAAGAYAPLILSTMGKKGGKERSLAYVLGNMLSAGGMQNIACVSAQNIF